MSKLTMFFWLLLVLVSSAASAPLIEDPDLAPYPLSSTTFNDSFWAAVGSYWTQSLPLPPSAPQPVCDLTLASMPLATPPLPTPTSALMHVAIGHGTQNYTCPSPSNATAVPIAIGAIATVYNASCIAARYPSLLSLLPSLVKDLPLSTSDTKPLSQQDQLYVSGHHYFLDSTLPTFDLRSLAYGDGLGVVSAVKNASVAAPASAELGSVPWLKLQVVSQEDGSSIQEVYRLNTAGGAAPASCDGLEGMLEVSYAAEYWFFG